MIVIGIILSAAATVVATLCLAALRQQRATARRQRGEVLSMLERQSEEMAQHISEVSRTVEALSESRQSIDAACNDGFALSRRRDAIRLLRSGMPPDTAASSLGMATREMRLIAKVSRILTID